MKFSCDGGKTSQILYLWKYTPEAKSQLPNMKEDDVRRADVDMQGRLVRSMKPGSQWVRQMSQEGNAITLVPDCPNGEPNQMVHPR
jgi:hypothetical protein